MTILQRIRDDEKEFWLLHHPEDWMWIDDSNVGISGKNTGEWVWHLSTVRKFPDDFKYRGIIN